MLEQKITDQKLVLLIILKRWTILTPNKKMNEKAVKKVSNFLESLGSKVKVMSDADHDKILSFTSHLPHAIAYNIVKKTMSNNEKS